MSPLMAHSRRAGQLKPWQLPGVKRNGRRLTVGQLLTQSGHQTVKGLSRGLLVLARLADRGAPIPWYMEIRLTLNGRRLFSAENCQRNIAAGQEGLNDTSRLLVRTCGPIWQSPR
jgi:hypothetical protein